MTERDIPELIRDEEYHQAFNLIVRQYGQRLYAHSRRMVISHEDADDCLQNAMLKVWTNLPKFRGESSLYTWLYKIVTNECLTFLKKRQSHRTVEIDLSETISSEKDLNGKELLSSLHKAVANLPLKQKAVFLLRYFDEMPYREMSEILDTSEGSLKASYHHACEKVRFWMERELNNDN